MISSTSGVIIDTSEEVITVKFKNLTIDFSRDLFSDMSSIKWGQPVLWNICERADGQRYSELVPTTDEKPNPRLEEVEALLDQIKSR